MEEMWFGQSCKYQYLVTNYGLKKNPVFKHPALEFYSCKNKKNESGTCIERCCNASVCPIKSRNRWARKEK